MAGAFYGTFVGAHIDTFTFDLTAAIVRWATFVDRMGSKNVYCSVESAHAHKWLSESEMEYLQVTDGDLVGRGQLKCEVHRDQDVSCHTHRLIVENRAKIEPAPAKHFDIGEVSLPKPKLVDPRRLVLELIGNLQDDEGRTGDQFMRFERTILRGFRYKVALLIGERYSRFAL